MDHPINNQFSVLELREREGRGIFADRLQNPNKRLHATTVNFRNHLLQSTEWAYRFYKVKELQGHRGCVNTIQWSQNGSHVITGSDDCQVMIWCGFDYKRLETIRTGHIRNIFAAHFVPHSNSRRFVSSGMDGEVRFVDLHNGASSNNPHIELLERSDGMCYKIAFVPSNPNSFIVTQQDGSLRLFDLRAHGASARSRQSRMLLNFRNSVARGQECGTNSIAFDPLGQNNFILGCSDPFLRLFDLRRFDDSEKDPIMKFAPQQLLDKHKSRANRAFAPACYASGVDFNARGEVAVTYSRDCVYTFDTKLRKGAAHNSSAIIHDEAYGDVCVSFIQKYGGARNVRTFLKEVAFYGDDEFVCTGSDDGHIYMWHKLSGRLVQRMKSDQHVVNGIAPHPFLPVLASCGIDSEGKIWELGRSRTFDGEKSKRFHEELEKEEANERDQRGAEGDDDDDDAAEMRTVNVRQLMALLRAMRQQADRRRQNARDRAEAQTAGNANADNNPEEEDDEHSQGIDIDTLTRILGGGEDEDDDEEEGEDDHAPDTQNDSEAPTAAPASNSVSPHSHRLSEAEREKELGNEAFRQSQFEQALEHYQRALTALAFDIPLGRDMPAVRQQQHDLRLALLLNRAAVFSRVGRHDRVIEDCTVVLRMDSQNMKALYRRAASRLALSQLTDAFTDIARARELYPTNAEVAALHQQIEAEIDKYRPAS